MVHDRIHAQPPSHHVDRWSTGTIASVTERDGHCLVRVIPDPDGRVDVDEGCVVDGDHDAVDLQVTLAVRELFVSRLDLAADESPVGNRVWYRKHGG